MVWGGISLKDTTDIHAAGNEPRKGTKTLFVIDSAVLDSFWCIRIPDLIWPEWVCRCVLDLGINQLFLSTNLSHQIPPWRSPDPGLEEIQDTTCWHAKTSPGHLWSTCRWSWVGLACHFPLWIFRVCTQPSKTSTWTPPPPPHFYHIIRWLFSL